MEVGNFWAALASYKWVVFWLVVFWYFRVGFAAILVSLANLCNRIKSTTFEFIGIKLGAEASIALGGVGIIQDEKFTVLLKAFQSPIVTNEEIIIKNQLMEAKCSDGQAIAVLVAQLANRNIFTLLCLIDRFIYEEQIQLLLYLNTNSKTRSGKDLEHFYISWSEKNKKFKAALESVDQTAVSAESTYEQFLSFLSTRGLISLGMNGYTITQLGKDYLSFIVKAGRQLPGCGSNMTVVDETPNDEQSSA